MLLLDHPGWTQLDRGGSARAVRCNGAVWVLVENANRISVRRVSGTRPSTAPAVDVFDARTLRVAAGLQQPLGELGRVRRLRNPDLWDALANSIIRQVIRAGHARTMYKQFCLAHGRAVTATPSAQIHLMPSARVVAKLPDAAFVELGMSFKMGALRGAAQTFLAEERRWRSLASSELLTEIQRVPRIGPWTAGATVADYTNDFDFYPHDDLAVRTWAARLAPTLDLPDEPAKFEVEWRSLAQGRVDKLTFMTLAWGAAGGVRR